MRSPGGTPPDATNEAPTFKALIKEFEAKYPKIKVNYVNVPFDQAQNKFKTAAQAGTGAPDVMRAEVAWTPEFASLGYLAAAGRHRRPWTTRPTSCPARSAATKFNGKTYAVPQVTDTLGAHLQQEDLARPGIDQAPDHRGRAEGGPRSTIKAKTGVDGLYLNATATSCCRSSTARAATCSTSTTRRSPSTRPRRVKAMATVAGPGHVRCRGQAAPSTDGYDNMQTAFKDGKVAMIINGPWARRDDLPGQGVQGQGQPRHRPRPGRARQGRRPAPAARTTPIYAGSKNLDASYAFVQFMNSAESQAKVAKKLGLLPTRTSAYDKPEVAGQRGRSCRLQAGRGDRRPRVRGSPRAASSSSRSLEGYQSLVGGKTTPEDRLKTRSTASTRASSRAGADPWRLSTGRVTRHGQGPDRGRRRRPRPGPPTRRTGRAQALDRAGTGTPGRWSPRWSWSRRS